MRKLIIITLLAILHNMSSIAQTVAEQTAVKPIMEQEGKIYVVMLVCLVVLGGLIAYLFLLDKRISHMEEKK
ncbi:MAG: CcmD family protein [Bacteroidota bacterium]|jgi:hypothetical protein